MSHHHPHRPYHPDRSDPEKWDELKLLREIVLETREGNALLYEQTLLLQALLQQVTPPNANSLTIGAITMQQFDPGATGIVLQAAFTPKGSTAPNPGFTVSWTDSNSLCTFSPDSSDPTGLTQAVTVSTSAVVGTTGTITPNVKGTFPDGTAADLSGTFTYTIGAAPSNNATGLSVTQLA